MKISTDLAATDRRGMLAQLDPEQWDRLRALCSDIRNIPPRTTISVAGEPLDHSLLLLDGIAVRYVGSGPSHRQMVALQVAYDFIDLHALPLQRLDHDVATLTSATLAVFPHDALQRLVTEDKELALRLWRMTLIDAAIHRQWTYRVGGLRALAGMAHFFCELDYRLVSSGRGGEDGYRLPLTQLDLGDIVGISEVHVNRTLRQLREAGLCTFQNGFLQIHDRPGLSRTGHFDASYLYGGDAVP
ncbi:Crp/Fnr family transcriptional regulator [Pelagovum pacificum]|uniref:Crp/Fnr family transcriptional regulator n=1 Tax=Pelagovum pacificum TaxID=2588711 RepID=A0A5C5GAB2_9RHOB|nr:Crp/Fnr family transcriptional regulator [Pelagovum pacificum]QQA41452.1 Crp/Fnr family transcriptional regulator [Pelagovum pacificum]TNY31745.1 Crp/Fnr family transcriptional regulator [Pelagovum pacificum]